MGCGSLDDLSEIRPAYLSAVEQVRKMRKSLKRRPGSEKVVDQLAPGRVFISSRGTPYLCVACPDLEYGNVEAVRLAHPVRMRRRSIRTHRVAFQRVHASSVLLDSFPGPEERQKWEELIARADQGEFKPADLPGGSTAHATTSRTRARRNGPKAQDLSVREVPAVGPLPPGRPPIPFTSALRRYFHLFAKVDSTQEQLWRSFLKHYRMLQAKTT